MFDGISHEGDQQRYSVLEKILSPYRCPGIFKQNVCVPTSEWERRYLHRHRRYLRELCEQAKMYLLGFPKFGSVWFCNPLLRTANRT